MFGRLPQGRDCEGRPLAKLQVIEGLVAHVPESVEITEPFGRFRLTYELVEEAGRRTLKVTKEIVVATSRVKRGDYAAFRAFAGKVDRAERREIGVSVGR